jgi:carbon monoxide dehydrogenase subunit G
VEISSAFEVHAPIDTAWLVLTDVELISPCIPGFQLQEVEGDEYRGVMKVKVGAVVAEYASRVTIVEQDHARYRAVLRGGGNERRGQGTVDAMIVSTLQERDTETTRVTMTTTLDVTGRIAGFGRNIMADVANRLVEQFVKCLETRVLTTT